MSKTSPSFFSTRQFRYLVSGSFILGINLIVAKIVFSFSEFSETTVGRNLGNLIATEIPILISFPIHKFYTWKEKFDNLFTEFIRYHAVLLSGLILRLFIFLIFDSLGFSFYFSTISGIMVIVLWNFLGFDRYVFTQKQTLSENSVVYADGGAGVEVLETVEEAATYNDYLTSKIIPFLGSRNLEIGAGTGTIANLIFEKGYNVLLSDLSDYNVLRLKLRFSDIPKFLGVEQDFLSIDPQNWDAIYSSNVLEHVPDDWTLIQHGLRILKSGGWFVAVVPATKILYSEFDKKIGHYRRYGWADRKRIESLLVSEFPESKLELWRPFNIVGAIGWFVKMRIFRASNIKVSDALIMDSIIPFLKPLDYIPFGFGQTIIFAIRK
ncbi:methyltransferase [Leptospira selangorensis]|uniref:Methyltransferase n=1 Tax=Leptospira selangorensis TaxID=2484982 RepID=A0A5F2BVP7_9LEPT|nr:GtrA family protein [Leptospira selangorensis]TGM11972.1 methyltransferase [Leptospira selangorensis]TGM15167.1 methyltransferase [Leptospira selangorensis]